MKPYRIVLRNGENIVLIATCYTFKDITHVPHVQFRDDETEIAVFRFDDVLAIIKEEKVLHVQQSRL